MWIFCLFIVHRAEFRLVHNLKTNFFSPSYPIVELKEYGDGDGYGDAYGPEVDRYINNKVWFPIWDWSGEVRSEDYFLLFHWHKQASTALFFCLWLNMKSE